MFLLLAHAGHDHGEHSSANPAAIIGAVAIAVILITLLMIFDRTRAQKRKKSKQKEVQD